MKDRKHIKVDSDEVTETPTEVKLRMLNAITDVLRRGGKEFYDELSDVELFNYGAALWEFHCDLRDEFSRREMHKAGYQWAAKLK